MAAYRNAILKMSARFEGLEFHLIARENNQVADVLARIGAKRDVVPPPQHLLGKAVQAIRSMGRGAEQITPRTQPHCPTPNILTQSEALPMK